MSLRNRLFRTFSIALLASTLWACGQAGPLYLPQDAEKEANQADAADQESQQEAENASQHQQQPQSSESLQPE